MKAAWYDTQGPAREVLVVGEVPDPQPQSGEVRIQIAASGVNPGDIKKRQNAFGYGMPYPRIIPHSDGAGVIDRIGSEVPTSRLNERVWCYGAQSYRPFGTAAEYVVVPAHQAIPLPARVSFEQGACFGIPGITAHRCVHVAGPVKGRTILVQGGAGAVGVCAVHLASRAGAHVIATVRSDEDQGVASRAGAHAVIRTDNAAREEVIARIGMEAPDGIAHIVEVAFGANIDIATELVAVGGSLAAYATSESRPTIPFWQMLFKNIQVFFMGSDDFPAEAKFAAVKDLSKAVESGWSGFDNIQKLPLIEIAGAHELIEDRQLRGRVVLTL